MGIKATLGKMSSMLQEQDEELWYHLEIKNKVRCLFRRRAGKCLKHIFLSARLAGGQICLNRSSHSLPKSGTLCLVFYTNSERD